MSEVERSIILANGGSISILSADNYDSLRGPGLDGVVVDEASRIPSVVWKEVLRPALSDRRGWALFLTTPNGPNWFKKLFEAAEHREDWERWQLPSSDNPLISQEELADLKIELGPITFAQEHLALFTEIEGALFPSSYFDDDVIWATDWPGEFEVSAIAIDPSIGREAKSGDYSAIVFAGLNGGQIYVDCDIQKRPPVRIVDDTYAMWAKYYPDTVTCEGNGFQQVLAPLFDLHCQLQRLPPLPLSMVHNSVNKRVRIQRLDPHFNNRVFQFRKSSHCQLLIDQCQMFPNAAFHDDGPDALEMAVRALNWVAEGGGGGSEEMRVGT